MKPRFFTALATCFVTGLPSFADEIQKGIAPTETADVRGFYIGMSLQDAKVNLAKILPNSRYKEHVSAHRHSKQQYKNIITLFSPNEDWRLHFTGHYSGNRLYALTRTLRYPENAQAPFKETRNNILDKYGLPTYASWGGSISYIFDGEKRLLASKEKLAELVKQDVNDVNFLKFIQENNNENVGEISGALDCFNLIKKVQNAQFFNPTRAKGKPPEKCKAAMQFKLSGNSNLLRTMTVTMADFQFVLSAAAIDQAEDEKRINVPTPKASAPKL